MNTFKFKFKWGKIGALYTYGSMGSIPAENRALRSDE